MKRTILIAILLSFALSTPFAFAQWKYKSKKDPMTDTITQTASVTSKNKQKFSFPYAGGSTARLVIRQSDGRTSIYMDIDKGQFLCSGESCVVTVRIDDNKAEGWDADLPDDGSTDTLFFRNADKIAEKLAASKRVRIEATFYQEGDRMFEFPTGNLKLPLQSIKSH